MANRKLDAYKLAVSLDAGGAKGLDQLKEADKQATKASSSLQKLKADFKDALKGDASAGRRLGESVGKNVAGGAMGVVRNLGSTIGGALGTVIAPGIGTAVGSTVGSVVDMAVSKLSGPVMGLINQGLELNEVLERAEVHFTAVLESRDAALKHLERLDDIEAKSGIDMRDLISASERLEEFNRDLGLTELELRAAADQAAAFGSGVEGFNAVADSLGLIAEKGELSSRSLLKLQKQGVHAMQYLSEATGWSEKKLEQMMKRGQLDGTAAARIIAEGIEKHRGGMAENVMQNTLYGQKFRFYDNLEDMAAKATRPTADALRDAYGLGNRVLGSAAADQAVTFIASSSEQFFRTIEGMLRGGLSGSPLQAAAGLGLNVVEGLLGKVTDGGTLQSVENAGVGLGSKLLAGTKKALGIESPSKAYAEVGVNVAEGFENGLVDRTSRGFGRWSKALERAGGDAFIKGVEGIARRVGMDPAWLLNVMAFESGINAQSANKTSSARGLIQFMNPTARAFGLSGSNDLLRMSALQQLKYVERYYAPFAGRIHNQGDAYAVVAAGRTGGRSGVLFRRGSKEYNANRGWDADRDGVITSREIGGLAFGRGGFTSVGGGGADAESRGDIPYHTGAFITPPSLDTFRPDRATAALKRFSTGVEEAGDVFAETTGQVEPLNYETRDLATHLMTVKEDLPVISRTVEQTLALINPSKSQGRAPSGYSKSRKENREDLTRSPQSALQGLKNAWGQVKQMGREAMGQFASGIGSMAESFVLLGSEADASVGKMVASVLAGVTAQAATLAVMETAYGIAALTPWGAAVYGPAPPHFMAAALFGSIAVGAGVAGRFVAGDKFKNKDSRQQSQQQNQQYADAGYSGNQFTRRAYGGPVYSGRAYLVGDGGRTEVFEPHVDGYVHPSVDAYTDEQRRQMAAGLRGGARGRGFFGKGLMERLAAALENFNAKVETASAGDVFVRGAKQNPKAAAAATVQGLDSDHKLIERMNRRLQPA